MAGDDSIEVKFRIFDGTDIGPRKYDQSTMVGSLKEFVLARWPQGKEIAPKTINDVKLINAGKILENNWTLGESRVLVGELPGGVITMHVVVRPHQLDKNKEGRERMRVAVVGAGISGLASITWSIFVAKERDYGAKTGPRSPQGTTTPSWVEGSFIWQ